MTQVKLLVDGGEMKPGPTLAQKLGPLGININEVIKKVNDATSDFKGLKVPVELNIDSSTKKVDVKVSSPPVSGLLKKELGVQKGSGTQKKMQVANASIEQIISVAKSKYPSMLCKDMKAAVMSVAGTCVSLGILIENKTAKETEEDIKNGKYDKEIKSLVIQTSPEKKKNLQEYFTSIKSQQEAKIKAELAAKEAEAAAKEAEKVAAGTATPTAAATPAVATSAKSKPEAKKETKKK